MKPDLSNWTTHQLVEELGRRLMEQEGVHEIGTNELRTLCEACELELLNRLELQDE